ncbi:hypothetical protein M8C21_021624, partial [Ambrosia artemisiifolia]
GAYISEDAIHVTPENKSGTVIGRVTYIERLHLWDKSSRGLASFSTNFSFVKLSDPTNLVRQDDGFIFFLAQSSSMIHGATDPQLDTAADDSADQFVWVEFDPYCNTWDREAINVNSQSSIKQAEWFNDVSSERECQVWINYDSASRNLSVSFTSFRDNRVEVGGVAHTVDLRDELPELVVFGFSAATGEFSDKNTVKSWIFNSSDLQFDANKGLSPHKLRLVVGLVVGKSILVTLLVILAYVLWKKKKKKKNNARATCDFAEKEKLGEGSFGGVYKGFLKDLRTYVAVKRVSKTSQQGIKEYASEVRIISRLRHRNLVQLTGWCHEKGELLLVYEYMENGSLDSHLFKANSLLTWGTRYQIAIDFNAKLGDFGLAKFVDHEKGSQTTSFAGTLGYMAPECVTTGKTSKQSDVFSFGVVALEIVCGRKSINRKAQEKQIWLPGWVWELYGTHTLLEAVDPRLSLEFDEDEVKRLMIVGLWCVHPDSRLRPSMRQVIQVLNSKASLPILPSKMPVASYFTTQRPSLCDGSST